jgi:hypothetical protein
MFRPLYDGDFAKTRRARRLSDGKAGPKAGPSAAIDAMETPDAGHSSRIIS